jgi:hypothetical protein
MTYEGVGPDGTRVRLHVDGPDAEVAYLLTLAPADHSTWSRPLELHQIVQTQEETP